MNSLIIKWKYSGIILHIALLHLYIHGTVFIIWDSFKNAKERKTLKMSWSLLLNIKGILSYSCTIPVETTTSITKISWSSDWDDHIWKKWTDWNHCPLYQQWLGQKVLMPTSPVTVLIPLCHPKHFTSHRQIHIKGVIIPKPILLSMSERQNFKSG